MIKNIDLIGCPSCNGDFYLAETKIGDSTVDCEMFCCNCFIDVHAASWPEAYQKFLARIDENKKLYEGLKTM